MLKKLDAKDIWIRRFEIPETRKHKKGFTVYKVVSTVFPKNFPDGATKITVWKRFKDFKIFHKELDLLFHQLYLKGTFPPLPKDKFFGRFEDAVIEERRKSALEVLEFAATYPQLFMNKVFAKFFEDGICPSEFVGDENGEIAVGNVLIQEEDLKLDPCMIPERVWSNGNGSAETGEHAEGVVVKDSAETSPSFSQASSPNGSPSEVIFPSVPNELPNESVIVIPSGETLTSQVPSAGQPNIVTFNGSSQPQSEFHNVPVPYSLQESKGTPFFGSSASLTELEDYFENDNEVVEFEVPLKLSTSASSVSLDRLALPSSSSDQIDKEKKKAKKPSGFNLFDFLPIFTKKQNKESVEQSLSQSLSESYVREAAGLFTVAQHHESNSELSLALDSYTEGIRVLLEGAQNDEDAERRALVKKKVAKYLSHAETIKRRLQEAGFAVNSSVSDISESRSDEEFVLLQNNIMPSSLEELKKYRVVGCTFNNLLIAVDTAANGGPECFVIKVLRKSACLVDPEKPSLIPSFIPFMVQLFKWFNTEDAIVLVLQYAAGGRLLTFVNSYQTKEISHSGSQSLSSSQIKMTDHSPIVNNRGCDDAEAAAATSISCTFQDDAQKLGGGDSTNNGDIIVGTENTNQVSKVKPENNAVSATPHAFDIGNLLDLATEDLIQKSRSLLQTVTNTLENQRKPVGNMFDSPPPSPLDHHDPISDTSEVPDVNNAVGFFNWKCDSVEEYGCDLMQPPLRIIPECCVKVWAAELVIGLGRLHAQGITFGDLELNNVLLGDNGHILLSYRALWNEVDCQVGWNEYTAPEVVNSLGKSLWKIHPSADWWSLGAILYFLLTGTKLLDNHPEGIHPQTVISVPPTTINGEVITPSAVSLLIELLQYSPNLRLGYYGPEEIKQHPFFGDFDWNGAESSSQPS